jgi:hypothetical protein
MFLTGSRLGAQNVFIKINYVVIQIIDVNVRVPLYRKYLLNTEEPR